MFDLVRKSFDLENSRCALGLNEVAWCRGLLGTCLSTVKLLGVHGSVPVDRGRTEHGPLLLLPGTGL